MNMEKSSFLKSEDDKYLSDEEMERISRDRKSSISSIHNKRSAKSTYH